MLEKFTERARKVMKLATTQALRLKSEFIGTEHILLAILDEEGGVAAKALRKLGVDQGSMRAEIERIIEPSTSVGPTVGSMPYSPRAKKVLELAGEEACRGGLDVVGTEHILLGLYREHEGIAYQVLHNFGVKDHELRSCMQEILGPEGKSIAGAGLRTQIPVKVKVSLFGEEHAGSSLHGLLIMGQRRLTLLQQVTVDGIPWNSREAIAAALAKEMGATAYLVESQETIKAMPG